MTFVCLKKANYIQFIHYVMVFCRDIGFFRIFVPELFSGLVDQHQVNFLDLC